METLGINWSYFIIQLLIFGAWPFLSLVALMALRRSHISGITQVLWAFLIAAIPVLGALAFFMVKPVENAQPKASGDPAMSLPKRNFTAADFVPGQTYRVIAPFENYDGIHHPIGERWNFVEKVQS